MTRKRIGIDLDGVLCDFDRAFGALLEQITGTPCGPLPATIWNWPRVYYSREIEDQAWRAVETSPDFWETIEPDPAFHRCRATLMHLADWADVYYITYRPFRFAKQQTEHWLENWSVTRPTVLIAQHKGQIAAGLGLTDFIDDKPSNIRAVLADSPTTTCYLRRRPYNAHAAAALAAEGVRLVDSIAEFIDLCA